MKEVFKMAWQSLKNSLSRTLLTMLGIIIGVTAVIAMTAVVNGRIQDQLDSAVKSGIHKITVDISRKNQHSKDITPEQLYEFYRNNQKTFLRVSPLLTIPSNIPLFHGDKKIPVYEKHIYGVGEDYLQINRRDIVYGRDLQYADIAGESLENGI